MLYDKPISNRSDAWLREMADLETEDCADDTYTASLVAPAGQLPQVASPPPHAPPHAEVAAVDPHREDGQMEGLAGSVLSYARMALCGICE